MKRQQIKMINVVAVISLLLIGAIVIYLFLPNIHMALHPIKQKILHEGKGLQISNPSAVYCKQLGYRYEIRTKPDGSQTGYCVFPDGSECEGWDFYNGECGQKWTYCETHGGTIIANKSGADCRLKNGTIIKETKCAGVTIYHSVLPISPHICCYLQKDGETVLVRICDKKDCEREGGSVSIETECWEYVGLYWYDNRTLDACHFTIREKGKKYPYDPHQKFFGRFADCKRSLEKARGES